MGAEARKVWRSRGQLGAGIVFGALVAALGLSQIGRSSSNGGGTGLAILLLVLGALIAVLFLRVALITDRNGIRIRNPLSSSVYGWEQIKGFRVGRHRVFSKVCVIDLVDGTSTYAFAIQVPNIRQIEGSKEQAMVGELTRLLSSHQGPGTT